MFFFKSLLLTVMLIEVLVTFFSRQGKSFTQVNAYCRQVLKQHQKNKIARVDHPESTC